MLSSELTISCFIVSDFEVNCFLVTRKERNDCFIVDPGMDPEEVIETIKARQLQPKGILITHGHYDHVGGIEVFRQEWPELAILIGEKERYKLTDPWGNLSAQFGFPMTAPDATKTLADGESFEVAGIEMRAILIPGHSAGEMIYLIEATDRPLAFVGDVIFKGSIGRTDFPDGNHEALLEGIQKSILTLPPQTTLFTGHGSQTTVAQEHQHNPWL